MPAVLTLATGTVNDGHWRGTLAIPAGTGDTFARGCCTVTVRAVNAFGASSAVSGTAYAF